MEDLHEDIEVSMASVDNALKISSRYGLQVEVVTWALKYMQEDPKITLSEAMEYGLGEWVK